MKKFFAIVIVASFLTINPHFLQSQNHIDSFENGICGTPHLEDLNPQDLIENTKKINPTLYFEALNRIAPNAIPSEDTILTLKKFYCLNDTSGSNVFYQVTAKLLYKSTITQIWVDTAEINNGHITINEVLALAEALEVRTPGSSKDSTKGIVRLLKENFGDPPNKDGDGRTDFLLIDIIDKKNSNAFTLGYFFGYDQSDGQFSNKRDILYIDTTPTIFNPNTGTRTISNALSTLAHEFQHLIHYNYDKTEFTFINEGLSLFSEVFCGYPLRNPNLYFANTNRPLFLWDRNNSLPDYSRAGLFTLYYIEQLGDDMIKSVINNSLHADTSLHSIFMAWKGYGFNTLFENWIIANYANDTTYDRRFGYKYKTIPGKPKLKFQVNAPNTTFGNLSIGNYCADYTKIYSINDSVIINLNGSDIYGKIIACPKTGNKWYDSVHVGQEYIIENFSSHNDSVIVPSIRFSTGNSLYDISIRGVDRTNYWEFTNWIQSLGLISLGFDNKLYATNFLSGGIFVASHPTYKFALVHGDSFKASTDVNFWSNKKMYIGSTTGSVWASSDTGITWNSLGQVSPTSSPLTGLSIDFNGNLYVSSFVFNWLFYRSTNQGSTWQNIDNNILNTISRRGGKIVADSHFVVWAFTDMGEVYRSTNQGNYWTLFDDTNAWDKRIAKVNSNGLLVYQSSNHGLIEIDPIGGKKLIGVPKNWYLWDIAFHPKNDSIIYISVSNPSQQRGVHVSKDKGKSWSKINNGLVETPVFGLGVDSRGMAVATTDQAAHKLIVPITNVRDVDELTDKTFYLFQNYPNPFNPTTTITFSIPHSAFITLKVYDILGREVATLVDEIKEAGDHNAMFSIRQLTENSALSSGIYIYQLISGENRMAKKMVILK